MLAQLPHAVTEYVAFALVAIAIFTVYIGTVAALRKDPVRERLKKFVPMGSVDTGFAYEDSKDPLAVTCENLLSAFGVDVEKAKRERYFEMARAGLMSTDAVVYFLFFRKFMQPVLVVCALLLFFYGYNLEGVRTAVKLLIGLTGILLLMIGLWGGRMYLSNRTTKRKKVLQHSFADTLDLLLVCVESGLPLDGALARVCRELKRRHPQMTAELERTRVELSVLNDRVLALTNLMERTDTPGFKSLVPALVQTEKFGTSIADTLRVLSDEQRIERQMQAETRAARIPVLITIPLICFILPPIFLVIMAPPIIKINQQGGLFGSATPKGR